MNTNQIKSGFRVVQLLAQILSLLYSSLNSLTFEEIDCSTDPSQDFRKHCVFLNWINNNSWNL